MCKITNERANWSIAAGYKAGARNNGMRTANQFGIGQMKKKG